MTSQKVKTRKKADKTWVESVLEVLFQLYPEAECALDHQDPFQLLIAVTLSAQTTDVSVNKVTPALFSQYPDPASLAGAEEEDVQQILRSIGMYKTKAKNIIGIGRALLERYDGLVPEDYDQLITLPGVGRKTANVVLSVAFGQQRIAVDTHVFRLANRIGLVSEKDVLKTELALMEMIPEPQWTQSHHALIFHGRAVCDARKPDCDHCNLLGLCKQVGV